MACEYGRKNIGLPASPYLMCYVYKRRFLDTQYGVRTDVYIFMIGDSPIVVNTRSSNMLTMARPEITTPPTPPSPPTSIEPKVVHVWLSINLRLCMLGVNLR